jgi:hypothetical protein
MLPITPGAYRMFGVNKSSENDRDYEVLYATDSADSGRPFSQSMLTCHSLIRSFKSILMYSQATLRI